jgi:Asp-tRNA(Asn)/Glu-tRNA(Gln) amidotransferase A subunit family amidase
LMSASLDTAGLLGATVEDVARVALAIGVPVGPAETAGPPRLAFLPTPLWDEVDPDARAALTTAVDAAERAGASVEQLTLDDRFLDLVEAQTTIQLYESARSLDEVLRRSPELLSPELRQLLMEGAALPEQRYATARATAADYGPELSAALAGYDGWLTPSATGVAPVGLEFTGSPLFCRAWTLIGAPCISLPLAWTEAGLPAGIQLVGAPGTDTHLLRTAAWLTAGSEHPRTSSIW